MAFYAYCLIRLSPNEPWPVLQGIAEHPVFPLRCGKYSILLSRLERTFTFTPRSIVEHGQVIAKVFETHTVLPMRFGTFFRTEKQIQNLIQENQKELLESFCHLRGKSEMRLKLVYPANGVNGSDTKGARKPPRDVFAAGDSRSNGDGEELDLRNHEMAHQLAARVGEMFRPLEQQISCRPIQNHCLLIDCAHLVDSDKVEIYQKLQSAASEKVKNCDLRISGPWPPYHFLPTSVRMPAAAAMPVTRRVAVNAR
jgi:gas vesicle protein GvpL/GvpF